MRQLEGRAPSRPCCTLQAHLNDMAERKLGPCMLQIDLPEEKGIYD